VEVLALPPGEHGVDLNALLRELGGRGINSLLVEGGAHILGAFLEQRLADEFYFFYAPKILGDPAAVPLVRGKQRRLMDEALPIYDLRVRRSGDDVLISGRLRQELY